ncbi:ankyrin repeat domain-containing protein [Elusimicrobiota bacterium]
MKRTQIIAVMLTAVMTSSAWALKLEKEVSNASNFFDTQVISAGAPLQLPDGVDQKANTLTDVQIARAETPDACPAKDIDGRLAYHVALGNVERAQQLVLCGADVNYRWRSSNTVLMLATGYGHYKIVKILVDYGANVNAKTDHGNTALSIALANNSGEELNYIVRILVENGANANAKDKNGSTVLMHAAKWGDCQTISTLIRNGADVNARDVDGTTALIFAAKRGHLAIVETLIDNNVDVNAKDNRGMTALMYAVKLGRSQIAKVLLENGANTNK